MSEIVGVAYFVCGGFIAGRFLRGQRDAGELADLPAASVIILAIFSWLAWPLVYGATKK